MALSFGKMPMTSDLRLISRFTRSSGFVDAIRGQFLRGKSMWARTSSRELSMGVRSLGCFSRRAFATTSH